MQQVLQWVGFLVGLPLEILVIAALLRGEYRRYLFIFFYAIADLLTTVLEIQPALAYSSGTPEAKKDWAWMFWFNERIMQVLVLLLVISLVYSATKHLRQRRALLAGIVCGILMVAAISLWAHYDPNLPGGKYRYMTPWTRDLNFCAAILDLGLWGLLIGSRQRDYKLLLVTGALGIQFTGGAIGQSLRHMSPAIVAAGGDFMMVTNLTRAYIWWLAFRNKPKSIPAGNASPE